MLSLQEMERINRSLEKKGKRTHAWGNYPNKEVAPCGHHITPSSWVTIAASRSKGAITCKGCLKASANDE